MSFYFSHANGTTLYLIKHNPTDGGKIIAKLYAHPDYVSRLPRCQQINNAETK